jgi:hypothetical protein
MLYINKTIAHPFNGSNGAFIKQIVSTNITAGIIARIVLTP